MKDELKKGFVFGVDAILAVSLIIGLVSIAGFAHGDETEITNEYPMNMDHARMHEMMHGSSDTEEHHSECCEMIEQMTSTDTEDIDKDGDGLCDMCGMSIEDCPMH